MYVCMYARMYIVVFLLRLKVSPRTPICIHVVCMHACMYVPCASFCLFLIKACRVLSSVLWRKPDDAFAAEVDDWREPVSATDRYDVFLLLLLRLRFCVKVGGRSSSVPCRRRDAEVRRL